MVQFQISSKQDVHNNDTDIFDFTIHKLDTQLHAVISQ
jgi:hypothetical protein